MFKVRYWKVPGCNWCRSVVLCGLGRAAPGLDSLSELSEYWTNSADCSCVILKEWSCTLGLWTEPWTVWSQKYNTDNLIPQIFLLQEWKQIFHGLHQPSWDAFLPSLSYVTLCLLQSSHGNLLRVFPKSWGIEASFKQSSLLTTALLMLMSHSGSPEFSRVSPVRCYPQSCGAKLLLQNAQM